MKYLQKILTGAVAAAMLLSMLPRAEAASSAELKKKVDSLKQERDSINAQLEDLKGQETANWGSTEEMVAQKNNIDQQMFLLYSEMENLEQQITDYGQLIAQNQQELDEAQKELETLNEKNKERIRAMEEDGKISYWSVVFKANSFTDLIDRLSMIREIAEADQRMLQSLDEAAQKVALFQEELVSQKASLEQSRQEQLETQKAMEEKRAEADELLQQLNSERKDLEAEHEAVEAEKNAMLEEIAQAEKEYTAQKQREEEERRRREEEERRKREEEERRQQAQQNGGSSSGSSSSSGSGSSSSGSDNKPTPPPSNDSGWRQPCSYVYISSPYGPRGSGFHNGVDFAANRGTPIYASRSGTVTKARSMTTSYGNHVVINHGDGFSSLYAHMDYFVVSAGQYVTQGQLIGYVGSTGNSTGPHLHFTIMYNGSSVNPMKYL